MNIKKSLFASILLVSILTGYSHAENPEAPKGPRQGGDIAFLLSFKELNITPEQRAQLEKIKADFESEQAFVRAELKNKRKEMEALLHGYEADRVKIEEKVKEMNELNGKLLLKATMSRVDARKILTREQFEKAKELIEKRREE